MPPRHLRPAPVLSAETVAEPDARAGGRKGNAANEQNGRKDGDFQKRKGDAGSQRVDAVGDGQRKHRPGGKGGVQPPAFLPRFLYHAKADDEQQHKGNPMVQPFYPRAEARPQQIADERHQPLRAAKPQAGHDHVLLLQAVHRQALQTAIANASIESPQQ